MSNTTANAYRISLTEMLKQEGRTFEAMAEEVMFGDAHALALCTEHCEVEPDGSWQPLRALRQSLSWTIAQLRRDFVSRKVWSDTEAASVF
jgi:hypothetical protein